MIESKFDKNLERKIDFYINNKLTQEEVDELWSELIQDEYYLDYTKSVANLRAIIEDERTTKEVAITHQIRNVATYGAAAAIAIIIGVIGVFNFNSENLSNNSLEPMTWIEFDTYRSASDNPDIIENEVIKEALRLANEGYSDEAIQLLNNEIAIEKDNKVLAKLILSLGTIQYNYGDYNNALLNFTRVVTFDNLDPVFLEKGYWYLANAQIQHDDLLAAEKTLIKTIEFNGQFSRIAERHLNAINKVK